MDEYGAYVGLDVHKDMITVAVALPDREEPAYRGEIRHSRRSLRRLMGRLSPHGVVLSFCFEAGPCGYGVYRAAQKRFCARYRHLLRAGKVRNQAATAVARELAGFIWAIVLRDRRAAGEENPRDYYARRIGVSAQP